MRSVVRRTGVLSKLCTARARFYHGDNVGILGLETYFPKLSVRQQDLEKHDGVAEGKYTIGLGQSAMSFCTDREDINSLSLTVCNKLLEKTTHKYNVQDIGRLEVGTETILDKSKSVKSVLMDLFAKRGHNMSIEGIDTTNACYGGTNALINSIQWLESSYSNPSSLAIALAGDIAVYSPGPARPTGGAAAVALLLGKKKHSETGQSSGLPLTFERGLRGSYMENAWDFYKPHLSSEYPVVDGHLSNECYLRALDNCYYRYKESFEKKNNRTFSILSDFDYCLFHTPYSKLVQKSWARLFFLDYLQNPTQGSPLEQWKDATPSETYNDRALMKAATTASKQSYAAKVLPSLALPQELGNSYAASLYTCLDSLVSNEYDKLSAVKPGESKRIGMFSYGSGLAATLFSLLAEDGTAFGEAFAENHNLKQRLAQRTVTTPERFSEVLALRERTHNIVPYKPEGGLDELFNGSFYLDHVDDLGRRHYLQKI